jgi:8-amino-3,8-dideoxy-alpha-D-manno-octulosonate transaminase
LSTLAQKETLAIDGGTPSVTDPLPPMYPGGMRIGQEEKDAVLEVMDTKRLFRYYGPTEGPSKVADFEAALAERLGVGHALAVSSGTTALVGALVALGIGPGDEVIVPAYTWISTPAAVLSLGAVPIMAEVDDSLTLDPVDTESRITPRTRVILPVHMRGAPADMDALMEISRRRNVPVLEDTAQAFGASFHGRRLGTIGDIGTYSLQFNKILTCGEGGVIATNDSRLHERATLFHDVAASMRSGISPENSFVGMTCRMSELQGAVAGVQLNRLEDILATMRRRKASIKEAVATVADQKGVRFRRLTDETGDAAIALIFYVADAEQASHVAKALTAEGARAAVLFDRQSPDYHIVYHWKPILERRTWVTGDGLGSAPVGEPYDRESWPQSLGLLERAVHLDVSPELTEAQAGQIAAALNKVLSSLP